MADKQSHPEIADLLREDRTFPPPADFRAKAVVRDDRIYVDAARDPEAFWAGFAGELEWSRPWNTVLDWQPPHAKWFVGGKINASVNCLDRHLRGARRNKAAIIWEGEPGDRRTLTYFDLHRQVSTFANVLKSLGTRKGDRVALYMPLVPELAIAMLACARIGATHSVVFGGFSADAVADRNNDAKAKLLITADGGWRRGKVVPLKENVNAALEKSPTVQKCIVLNRVGQPVEMKPGRDLWWHELMQDASPDSPAAPFDSEHPLYVLYASGSTGKPKGVLHTSAGYLLGVAYTHKLVFDLKEEDVYWCTADCGWITGHSYLVYGPLANGATCVMYEGAPNHPKEDRFWDIIEKYGVTVFYTAPTAIRAFVKWGDEHVTKHDLSSLRLLGTVGEPINPEAWMWYKDVIGGGRCPIVDTWWQTETGAIMCTPLPGVTPTKPGSCTRPFFGVDAAVVDKQGHEVPANAGGYFVIRKPWPSMLRTVWGDDERFQKAYFSEIPDAQGHVGGTYFTGDGARKDSDGYFWVMGRVDDVVNVAGHRLGTMEVESALVAHPKVAEAAVVGRPDDFKGQALCAFVTVISGIKPDDKLKDELKAWVGKEIG